MAQIAKNPPAMQETQVQSLREGHGNPLQYSCLENSTDRRAWPATVHGVGKSQTRLSNYTFTFKLHTFKVYVWDFPGGSVVNNLSANIGDTGLCPRRSHMP